jgi:hypothetical protein
MADEQAFDFGTPVKPGTEWDDSPQPVVPPVPAAAKPKSAATLGSALRTTKPVVVPKLPTGAPPEFSIPLSEQTFDETVKNPLQALRVAQTDPATSQINQLRLSLLAGKTESQAKEQEAKNAVLREEERTKFSEQYVKDAQNEAKVRQSKIQEASPFAPTQESARDLASIFSLLSVAAFGSGGKGKYAGMQALSAMTGAMKGYKEGQKAIYDKEVKIFEENLQVIKSHNEEIQKEYTIAMDLLSKNKDLGEQKIKELAAKDNTGIQSMLARAHNYKGLGEAIKVVRDAAQKAQDKVDELKEKHEQQQRAFSHAEKMANEKTTYTYVTKGDKTYAISNRNPDDIREVAADLSGAIKVGSVPKAGGAGGAAAGAVERMTQSMGQAADALTNLGNLQITTRNPVYGQKTFDSLFTAPLGVLNQAMTNDATQFMQTRMAGVSRTLASLETGGAATGLVGLTNSIEKGVAIPAGASPAVALDKLAEMRRIIESAARIALASPNYNPSQKQEIEKNLNFVRKAIPFTQNDLDNALKGIGPGGIKLSPEEKKMTFTEFLTNNGLNRQSKAPTVIKTQADYNVLPSGSVYIDAEDSTKTPHIKP